MFSSLPTLQTQVEKPTILLSDVMVDERYAWQVHNCKLTQSICRQDLPLPFLYHYDQLDPTIKANHPLSGQLLLNFNTPMLPAEAAHLLNISQSNIPSPWHVKLAGSLVVFSDELQLAVRLHWTNTIQTTQPLYCQTAENAKLESIKEWQFIGRVDILYRRSSPELWSICRNEDADSAFHIVSHTEYQHLPSPQTLFLLAALESGKSKLPWFDEAITSRIL